MTTLTVPDLVTAADLKALFDLEAGPEYILAFSPPYLYERVRDRLSKPGWWELLTVTDWDAGAHAADEWTLHGSRDTPAEQLAAWVTEKLGFPVNLELEMWKLKPDRPLIRWRDVPVYWVRRDT